MTILGIGRLGSRVQVRMPDETDDEIFNRHLAGLPVAERLQAVEGELRVRSAELRSARTRIEYLSELVATERIRADEGEPRRVDLEVELLAAQMRINELLKLNKLSERAMNSAFDALKAFNQRMTEFFDAKERLEQIADAACAFVDARTSNDLSVGPFANLRRAIGNRIARSS